MDDARQISVDCVVITIVPQHIMGDELADVIRDQLIEVAVAAQNAILNFSKVTFISGSGFRPLLSLHRLVRQNGGRVVFCHLHPDVRAILDSTRLLSSKGNTSAPFLVAPTVAEAMALLFPPENPV